IGAVSRAEGPTSSMMKHGPMNTAVSISAASLAALYQQVFSGAVVMYCYHVIWSPITIHDPVGLLGQLVLAWLSGIAIGLIFKGLIPWQPEAFGLLCSVYQRIDVIASGKMFVANQLSAQKLFYFDWNPLFHIIDQARGDIFLNYHPHFSSTFYAIKVSLACALVGLMAEFYTRKYVSVSWGMGR
ncbi:MAG: ABC transporter permease, partial [Rhodobacteraceae bacterium]|nr:ABC transporter permease [Paracoccaceae bacterium]